MTIRAAHLFADFFHARILQAGTGADLLDADENSPPVQDPEDREPQGQVAEREQQRPEAGVGEGFETELSFDLGAAVINEPICVLT